MRLFGNDIVSKLVTVITTIHFIILFISYKFITQFGTQFVKCTTVYHSNQNVPNYHIP